MRRAFVLVALLLAGCSPAAGQAPPPQPRQDSVPQPRPPAVVSPVPAASPPAPQPGDRLRFGQLAMFGATGWAVVSSPIGEGDLVHTTDGGLTWHVMPAGASPGGREFSVLDGERALVAGRLTLDGGASWLDTGLPITFATRAWAAPESGAWWYLAAGEPASQFEQEDARIYRSADGGRSWRAVEDDTSVFNGTPAPPGAITFQCGKAGGLTALDNRTAWVAGGCAGGFTLQATTDGGVTWHAVALPGLPPGYTCEAGPCSLAAPRFITNFAYAVAAAYHGPDGEASLLLVSYDRGQTWSWRHEPGVVTFMDQADAYAIADGGVPGLYASHDGGRSWALVNDGAYLAEIDCLGFFDCWALTQGDTAASGDLLRSADGGRTWTHLNPVVA